ncbi:MAG: pyridoxal phosphate-dependent aminotransferase family protein [Candidatus Omnitrophica bacterium]|nr:pyridoxal phosphate-dependent aminotransferase family protein [Candidatus Omnitrophota bacterium]
MKKEEFVNSFSIDKKLAEDIDFNPYSQIVQSGLDRNIVVNGKKLISLGTNDYLGLANNNTIKKEAIRILETFGMSMCGTPIVVGQTNINRSLETEIAKFLKQDDALVFPSCYQSNMSIFQLLANEEDVIIADREIHSSLLNGIALCKASFKMFPHNNAGKLEKILERYQARRMKFVVVEGLYSTNGDIPPLAEIAKIAKKFDAFIIVDDAHGLGVLGKEGRGIAEVSETFKDIDLITGSFGKAVGTFGGFITGNRELIDAFRYGTPMYLYSTALPPSIAAATIVSLRYIKDHPELREKIGQLATRLLNALKSMNFSITKSSTPVVSVIFRSSEDTFLATKMLFEKGVYAVPFIPPSVPRDTARIRLTLNATLKEEDVDFTIKVFDEIRKEKPEWVK